MKTNIKNNWSLLMVSGLIALFYGFLAIFASQALILTIVTYFGIVILIAGAVMLYGVYTNYKNQIPFGLDLAQAILIFILGILLTFFSQKSLQVFVIIVGVWAIIMGGIQIYISFKIPKEYSGKISFISNGVVTLIFGVALLFNPFEMAKYIVILTGILAILLGGMLIFLSLKLKGYRKNININY